MLGLNPTQKALPSLILAWHCSIIFSVDLFDLKGLLIPINRPTYNKQSAMREMLFALLWSPRSALSVTRSQVRSLFFWKNLSNHDLNDTLHSVYSPFRFYWIDVENPSERKKKKKSLKKKKCTTAMLRWKTRLTDRNSNMWYTLKVFAHTSLTNAMQWGYDPWLQVTSQVSQVRDDLASQTR